jgi:hypothetical protein
VLDPLQEERQPGRQLVGGALEGGIGVGVSRAGARRVADAPVDLFGRAGELGADLADAIAEADHVVEALAAELVEMLGSAAGEVDPALAHHAHRVRVQRLRLAAGAQRLDLAPAQALDERFGDLRAGAVAGAEEEDARRACTTARPSLAGRAERAWGMERGSSLGKQLAAAGEVEAVVGVAAVEGAAPGRNESPRSEPPQVVRNETLRLLERRHQLAHATVAARELAHQAPPQRVAGELEDEWRRCGGARGPHTKDDT